MIPVLVVTGFLGCGKTSFLRHLLPLCREANLRPALVINEVGDVDVDGELLSDIHAEQVRLVGGCVCCTLQAQLSDTIYDILERKAGDIIIIECSGLSNPMDVVSALSAPAMLSEIAVSHIVCLVDSRRVEKLATVAILAAGQISAADVLVLNKADTVDDQTRASVESFANNLNPHATTYWASYGDIGREALLGLLTDSAPVRCACGCGHGHHDHASHDHRELPASFCTLAVELPASIDRESLEALLNSLPESVIRAKGFAKLTDTGWHAIQKTYDYIQLTPMNDPAPSVGPILICIGQHLNAQEIRDLVGESLRARN